MWLQTLQAWMGLRGSPWWRFASFGVRWGCSWLGETALNSSSRHGPGFRGASVVHPPHSAYPSLILQPTSTCTCSCAPVSPRGESAADGLTPPFGNPGACPTLPGAANAFARDAHAMRAPCARYAPTLQPWGMFFPLQNSNEGITKKNPRRHPHSMPTHTLRPPFCRRHRLAAPRPTP